MDYFSIFPGIGKAIFAGAPDIGRSLGKATVAGARMATNAKFQPWKTVADGAA